VIVSCLADGLSPASQLVLWWDLAPDCKGRAGVSEQQEGSRPGNKVIADWPVDQEW
tara:strand:+ start:449 stop:616 length:168 start_codon:yes stop_codon:yes gene_type:complete